MHIVEVHTVIVKSEIVLLCVGMKCCIRLSCSLKSIPFLVNCCPLLITILIYFSHKRFRNRNIHFLNNVIIIKTKVLLLRHL